MLRDAVSSIAAKFGHEYYVEKAHADERTDELWNAVAEPGSSGSMSPRSTAAAAVGITELAAVAEELAAAGCPLLVIVVSPAICATIIAKFGTEAQKQRWLPGFATGELKMAFAITEPDAGSNSHNLSLTATKDGDLYRLNGSKYYISGVDECEAILVVTRSGVDPDTGRGRLSLFVVDADTPGLEQAGPARRDHRPREAVHPVLRQRPGRGRPADRRRGRGPAPGLLRPQPRADPVGRHRQRHRPLRPRQGGRVRPTREVWGTPIGRHQGIAHPLAKAKIEVELARLMTDKAAWHCDHAGDTPVAGEAANMAKYAAAEATLGGARPGHPDPRRKRHVHRVRPGRPVGHGAAAAHRPGQPRDDPELRGPALPRPAQVLLIGRLIGRSSSTDQALNRRRRSCGPGAARGPAGQAVRWRCGSPVRVHEQGDSPRASVTRSVPPKGPATPPCSPVTTFAT